MGINHIVPFELIAVWAQMWHQNVNFFVRQLRASIAQKVMDLY